MSFYNEVIQRDPRFHSTEEVRDLALLEPITRLAAVTILSDAKALGIDLFITETFRSTDRQVELFERGATHLRNVGVHHYVLTLISPSWWTQVADAPETIRP